MVPIVAWVSGLHDLQSAKFGSLVILLGSSRRETNEGGKRKKASLADQSGFLTRAKGFPLGKANRITPAMTAKRNSSFDNRNVVMGIRFTLSSHYSQ
jgi:hypothetical protein